MSTTISSFPITGDKKADLAGSVTTIANADVLYGVFGGVTNYTTWLNLISQLAAQPLNANLTTISGLGAIGTFGQRVLIATNPSVDSYARVTSSGFLTYRTFAQVLSDIGGQAHSSNLDTLSGLAASGIGGSMLVFPNVSGRHFLQFNGDTDQTITALTPAQFVDPSLISGGEIRVALATPRTTTISTSATPSPNASTDDVFEISALAGNCTIQNPSGTPAKNQKLLIKIKDAGTGKTVAWGTAYSTGILPGTSPGDVNKTIYCHFIYSSLSSKWDCQLAVTANS